MQSGQEMVERKKDDFNSLILKNNLPIEQEITDDEELEKMPLTLDDVSKYINIKKENGCKLFDDVQIIQDNKVAWPQDEYKKVFEQAYEDLCKEAETSNEEVVRKVVFYNNKQLIIGKNHIICFVLFYDKNNDKPISLFTGTDNDLKQTMWYCVDNGEHNFWKLNSQKFLNIQKDDTSCGTLACETAKHLTIDWYKKHMIKMKELEQADIDILKRYKQQQGCITCLLREHSFQEACRTYKINNIADIGLTQEDAKKTGKEIIDILDKKMKKTEQQYLILPTKYLPKELIAYKQGGLEELKTTYQDIFNKNLQRGNIKRIIKSEDDTQGKAQNRRLQDRSRVIKNYDEHITKKEAKRSIEEYINNNNNIVPKNKSLVDCIKKLQNYDDGKEFLRNCHCNIALRARAKREHQVFLTYEKIQNDNPANVNELVSMDNVKSWNMCGCSCC